MPGYYDTQGIYRYAEDDDASPFSTLLNLGQASVSTELGKIRTGLASPPTVSAITPVNGWTTFTAGGLYSTPQVAVKNGLCYLTPGLLSRSGATAMSFTAGFTYHIAWLPSLGYTYRPTSEIYGVGVAFPDGSAVPVLVYFAVQPDGQLQINTSQTVTFGASPAATNSLRIPTIVWPLP